MYADDVSKSVSNTNTGIKLTKVTAKQKSIERRSESVPVEPETMSALAYRVDDKLSRDPIKSARDRHPLIVIEHTP